jgi:hypothetical protein
MNPPKLYDFPIPSSHRAVQHRTKDRGLDRSLPMLTYRTDGLAIRSVSHVLATDTPAVAWFGRYSVPFEPRLANGTVRGQ